MSVARSMPIVWPADTPTALDPLRADDERITAQRRETVAALQNAMRRETTAPQADARAVAEAARNGLPLPTETEVEKVAAEVIRLRGHLNGLDLARDRMRDDIVVAVEAHRVGWRAGMVAADDAARAEYAAAVEALDAARAKVDACRADLRWLDRFPERVNRVVQTPPLALPAGDVEWAQILDALRADTARPAPAAPGTVTHEQAVEAAMAAAVQAARRSG